MSASNKSLLFSLGLVLGLLAGAGFFIFKMDDLLKKGSILNSSKDTIIIQQQVISKEEDTKKKVSKKRTENTDTSTMSSAELLAKKYSREVPIRKVMAEADSLLNDNTIVAEQEPAEQFVVKKDELIGSRDFTVINLEEQDASNPADSLLEKTSGIKDQGKKILAALKVEFWQSPINYKGYKMTKNKIVLFGINPEENLKLFHTEDVIFLKHNQNYYRLYFTDEYKQFEKVTDALLISKLK